jgi:hypothetical protein
MAITVYNVMPIPPDDSATQFVEAGVLRIGVEYRTLDVADLDAAYDGGDAAEIAAATPAGLEDEGVSIHVFGDDGLEYLRFDMFDGGPHYHYIAHAKGENVIVDYDRVAFGEMLPWALSVLRERIHPMLDRAGASDIAGRLDSELLNAKLADVETLVKAADADIESQRRARSS